jgi:hypothetical protein
VNEVVPSQQSLYDARLDPQTLEMAIGINRCSPRCGSGLDYLESATNTDMASYVPAESIAYIEANDLAQVADGLSRTEAWRALAEPLGAPRQLILTPAAGELRALDRNWNC